MLSYEVAFPFGPDAPDRVPPLEPRVVPLHGFLEFGDGGGAYADRFTYCRLDGIRGGDVSAWDADHL